MHRLLAIAPPAPWSTKFFFRLAGAWGRFTPTKFGRSLMQDRVAERASIDRMLQWDIGPIVVGHGRNLTSGGHAALREAFAFLR
jgi:hypothetical protein